MLKSELCDEAKTLNKINGTSQNGGAVHTTTNCHKNPILDELDDIDECDALDDSCKVDGKLNCNFKTHLRSKFNFKLFLMLSYLLRFLFHIFASFC